jgi:hypothetical protein
MQGINAARINTIHMQYWQPGGEAACMVAGNVLEDFVNTQCLVQVPFGTSSPVVEITSNN